MSVKRRNGLIARGDINGDVNGNESSIAHIYIYSRPREEPLLRKIGSTIGSYDSRKDEKLQ